MGEKSQSVEMVANGFKWIFQRGRGIMRKYGVLFLLLADVFFKSSNGKIENRNGVGLSSSVFVIPDEEASKLRFPLPL